MGKEKTKKKVKKDGYFKEVGKEMKKVKWPDKKDVVKYTVATVIFVLVVVGFFILLNMGMSWLKGMFN